MSIYNYKGDVISNESIIDVEAIEAKGLSEEAKTALLSCFQQTLWRNEGAVYYDALNDALYPETDHKLTATLVSDNRMFFEGDPIATVKQALYVAYDGQPVTDFVVSGSMVAGNQTFTVTYNGKTTRVIVPINESKHSLSFTSGDLEKYNGSGNSYDAQGVIPVPYLLSQGIARNFYSVKGHYPYYDNNVTLQSGKYPIPIPSDATSVSVVVTPSNLQVALNGWEYLENTKKYSYLTNTDTGFKTGSVTVELPSSTHARALNMTIRRSGSATFDSASEPTQCVVTFS